MLPLSPTSERGRFLIQQRKRCIGFLFQRLIAAIRKRGYTSDGYTKISVDHKPLEIFNPRDIIGFEWLHELPINRPRSVVCYNTLLNNIIPNIPIRNLYMSEKGLHDRIVGECARYINQDFAEMITGFNNLKELMFKVFASAEINDRFTKYNIKPKETFIYTDNDNMNVFFGMFEGCYLLPSILNRSVQDHNHIPLDHELWKTSIKVDLNLNHIRRMYRDLEGDPYQYLVVKLNEIYRLTNFDFFLTSFYERYLRIEKPRCRTNQARIQYLRKIYTEDELRALANVQNSMSIIGFTKDQFKQFLLDLPFGGDI